MSRRRFRLATIAAALVAAAVGVVALSNPGPPVAPEAAPVVNDSATVDSGPAPARAAPPPVATTEPSRPQEMLELPDGTFVPTLNGTQGAPPLATSWSPRFPYAPIVGVHHSDAGVDWYVHQDGTMSTTEMKWRNDLGRMDAMTRVAHPGPKAPPVDTTTKH